MDALDLLVDFATFLASSTTISKGTNVESDARKTVSPSDSTTLDGPHAPTPLSIKQETHFTTDRESMFPRERLAIEAYPEEALGATQPGYHNKVSGLKMHPKLAPRGLQDSPSTHYELYTLEHSTDSWYHQEHLDERQNPPSWMGMQQHSEPVHFGPLDRAPYPFPRTVPGVDGVGHLVVAGDGIFQSSCSIGICNCRHLTPRFANTIAMPSNDRYYIGNMFRGNAEASLHDPWVQWH